MLPSRFNAYIIDFLFTDFFAVDGRLSASTSIDMNNFQTAATDLEIEFVSQARIADIILVILETTDSRECLLFNLASYY